jgi:3-hydroxyacyl-[acyl-carrier-protein] dehydratase
MNQSSAIIHKFKENEDSESVYPAPVCAAPSFVGVEEIMTLIPHRYPFLLIDRVENIIPDHSATGIKNVSINEWFFQGHFPEKPIFPGVLIIEALAQTAGVLVMKTLANQANQKDRKDKLVYFMCIDETRFRVPVVPGNVMHLKVAKLKNRGSVWKFTGEAYVDNILVAESVITAKLVDK